MQIARWGNSLAIRIPAQVARELGLQEGDDVDLVAVGEDRLAVISEAQRRDVALNRIRRLRGAMPADFRFDRDEANAR